MSDPGPTEFSLTQEAKEKKAKAYHQAQFEAEIQIRKQKKMWFNCDNYTCYLTLIGLTFAIYQRASSIHRMKNICMKEGIDDEKCRYAMFDNRYPNNDIYAIIIWCFNIPSAVTFVIGMYNRQMWINGRIESNKHDNVHSTEQKQNNAKGMCDFGFWFKLVVLLVSPIPYFEIKMERPTSFGKDTDPTEVRTVFLSDLLFSLMFIRLIFAFTVYFNKSGYKTQFVKVICGEENFYPGNWFILKMKLVRDPVYTVLGLFFASVFVFSNMIVIFELENFLKNSTTAMQTPYYTAIYFTMITLSTIGYGDYCPITIEGRFVTMLMAIWGAILISLFVTVVSGLFDMKEQESRALTKVDVSRQAARVIMKSLHYLRAKKKYYIAFQEKNPNVKSDFLSKSVSQSDKKKAVTDKKLTELYVVLQMQRIGLENQLKAFKEQTSYADFKDMMENDTQNQVYAVAKTIKKEIFDMSDTMDLMSVIIKNQDALLRKQDARMALIEQALINKGAIDAEDLQEEAPKYEDKYTIGRFYNKSEEDKEILCRFTERFERYVYNDMKVKSSNRNAILMGKEKELVNVGLDEYTGDGKKEVANVNNTSIYTPQRVKDDDQKEGGEHDDDFKRMD